MSGFESFESSSDKWMNRFKNFLMEKRTVSPSPERDSCYSPSPTFDLDKDFHQILKEKCPSFKSSYDKENFEPTTFNNFNKTTLSNIKSSQLNESLMPMSPTSQNCLETTANDSFFYLEKICDKTISDPNSTIHSYVENMRKNTTNSINISNNTTNEDEENAAIERLLYECDIKENFISERTVYHGDQTQLGDIEAPSGLWETTVSDENLLQMSPTKRVGLLRPSTIIEEPNSSNSESENSKNNSSVFSFKTAQKSSETIYETANDTIRSEVSKNNKKQKYNNSHRAEYSVNMEKSAKDSAFSDTVSSVEQNITDSLNSEQTHSKNTLDDVSSILIDSLNYSINKSIAKNSSIDSKNDFTEEKESCIEISDEEDIGEESVLNEGFSLHLNNDNEELDETLSDSCNGLNVSRVFNDTLEEVDYILKKGMKMMNNTPGQPLTIKNKTVNSATLNAYTPSPKKQSPKTPNTIISKQFSIQKNTGANDKKEHFKIPTFPGGSRIPQPKSLLNVKKTNPYANIISPVGAYIKNTPKTPIINNIRETTVRSLDYEQVGKNLLPSKQQQQQQNVKTNSKGYLTSLPKKAYHSANYVEIRDERVPLNIPGGNKIHKYLHPALVPTVVRHEGKMKMMKSDSSDDNSPTVNTTVDNSLADLSVMSGDVSLYTIRDAQNFGKNIEKK